MVQCVRCQDWFHETVACMGIQVLVIVQMVPFSYTHTLLCSRLRMRVSASTYVGIALRLAGF